MASPRSPEVAAARARLAGMHVGRGKARSPDQLADARRDLEAAKLADHVERVVAGWPPLTDAQLDRVAALLRAGGQST